MINLNQAATSLPKPECVIQATTDAMRHFSSGGRGVEESALMAQRMVFLLRQKLARFFDFHDDISRVIFTGNATQALNTVFFGLFNAGDHVITTDLEHNSVLRPLEALRQMGILSVSYVPADAKGRILYSDFERLIGPHTRAIVVTHQSNLTGNIVDLHRVSRIAHKHGLILIVDASQSAGALPISMQEMGIDILCFTGHKSLMGPQGTGGFLVRQGIELRPLMYGGTGIRSYDLLQPDVYPEHLEAGTLNMHGLAGLSSAIDYLGSSGVERIHDHEMALTAGFWRRVRQLPGVTLYGDFSDFEESEGIWVTDPGPRTGDRMHHGPIVTLNLAGISSSELADALSREYGIAVRAGAHCAPRMHRALGTEESGSVRFSFGWYNTPGEMDRAAWALRRISQDLR